MQDLILRIRKVFGGAGGVPPGLNLGPDDSFLRGPAINTKLILGLNEFNGQFFEMG